MTTNGYPVLLFMSTDEASSSLEELAADLRNMGATLLMPNRGCARDHPDVDAVCLIQSFYGLAVRIATHRGVNLNRPRHLNKVTRTR